MFKVRMSYEVHTTFSMPKIFPRKGILKGLSYKVFSKDNHTVWDKSRTTSLNHTKKMDEYKNFILNPNKVKLQD